MADLQEELQAILGDPQAMGQITAIARALTGGGPAPSPAPPGPPPQEADYVPVENAPQGQGFPPSGGAFGGFGGSEPPPDGNFGPPAADIPDLSSLAGLLGGGLDIDPKLIQIALRVYTEYSAQDNEKAALLAALKPFLRQERLEKMEKAEKVARLSRLVRVAIQLLKEEGGERV